MGTYVTTDTTQPIWYGPCPFCQQAQRIQSPLILTTESLTLRQALAQAHISGAKLARMSHTDYGTVFYNILYGRSRGSAANRERIAAALGIPVAQILWPEKVV